MNYDLLKNCIGFQWDSGNSDKNWIKHRVTKSECEQVFFNEPIVIADDEKHSDAERRWYLLGITNFNRKLFVVFTVREKFIRIISARDMNKKERKYYDQI